MALLKAKIQEKKNAALPIMYKELSFSVKKPKVDSRTISGYLAVFGNKDCQGDIIVKGAFAKSISDRGPDSKSGNKIAFLWQHDMKEPLGRMLTLKEDDYGLYFECELDDIDVAERALKQLESGTLDKFSIGFMYVWDKMEYDETLDAFIIKELYLMEGSVVTLAANDATYYAGLKADDRATVADELDEDTERFIKGLSFPKQIELRQLLSKHISLAKSEPVEELKQSLKDDKQAGKKKSKWAKLAEINN
jgi:HK97 family phage prohead protease